MNHKSKTLEIRLESPLIISPNTSPSNRKSTTTLRSRMELPHLFLFQLYLFLKHSTDLVFQVFFWLPSKYHLIYIYFCCEVTKVCPILLRPHGLLPARLLCPWGFSRQEYWSGLPCPSPGDLPNPGIESQSPAWAGGFFSSESLGKPNSAVLNM